MGLRGDGRRIGGVVLALASVLLAASAAGRDGDEAVDSGFVEREGVRLTLIDVEAVGKDGEPLQGLTPSDFVVRLNGRKWPIYSVDDLCECPQPAAESPSSRDDGGDGSAEPAIDGPDGTEPWGEYDPAPHRYVLYFDFSQLQLEGRASAVEKAKRWVRSKRPRDQAMVVAYATAAGLRELSAFTEDPEQIEAVIDAAWRQVEMIDPFPEEIDTRLRECARCCDLTCARGSGCGWCVRQGWTCANCCSICTESASEEYFHGRRSLKALRRLLVDLQREPGRKHLVFFYQNGGMYPARFYPVSERTLGDHLGLLDEVAAEATLARTVVHAAYSGDDTGSHTEQRDEALTLGLNIADLTGGSYNRSSSSLEPLLAQVGRSCECIYRVALEPPDEPSDAIYRVKVKAAGRKLPYESRVRFIGDTERWTRDVGELLASPESANDLELHAAVLPVSASDDGWDVVVQVALDLGGLLPLPAAEGRRQWEWEVGALLTQDEGRRSWEMLGISRGSWESEGAARTVLHSRRFERLAPGRYRLGAFVRDRNADVFGGAEVLLELPEISTPRVVGPIVLITGAPYLDAPLPLLRDKGARSVAVTEARAGPVPAGSGAEAAGEPLTVVSLLCGKDPRPTNGDVVRYVSKDETPLFRFEPAEIEPAGTCVRIVDVIETWRLVEGGYSYHLLWGAETGRDPLSAVADFLVSTAGPAAAPRLDASDRF